MWEERRSLYERLTHTAEHFWLAEREGRVIGFSRSILRDGLLQLPMHGQVESLNAAIAGSIVLDSPGSLNVRFFVNER